MINIEKIFPGFSFSDTEINILSYIFNNINTLQSEGIRSVAKKTFTSPTTIIRLSKKLGYTGFVELIYALRYKVEKNESQDFMNNIKNNQLFSVSSDDAIPKFISALDNGGIFIYSLGFSQVVGQYFYKKLLVLGKSCYFTDCIDFDVILDNHIEKINTVIIISKSGETKFCISTCELALNKGIDVITFTGNSNSSLSSLSSASFYITDNESLDDHNFYPNVFFAHCIESFEFLVYKYFLNYVK